MSVDIGRFTTDLYKPENHGGLDSYHFRWGKVISLLLSKRKSFTEYCVFPAQEYTSMHEKEFCFCFLVLSPRSVIVSHLLSPSPILPKHQPVLWSTFVGSNKHWTCGGGGVSPWLSTWNVQYSLLQACDTPGTHPERCMATQKWFGSDILPLHHCTHCQIVSWKVNFCYLEGLPAAKHCMGFCSVGAWVLRPSSLQSVSP